ncbi:dihydrofolate reductase-like domain-containing protein [Blastocladiella britannica]|nr:dihydrofolate reductase-like domain-containing protein [Blastocladiella britannica]
MMKHQPFSLVVAAATDNAIGRAGGIPWPRLKTDMAFFRDLTTAGPVKNAVVMGRKTWDSLPARFRPLPGRLNVVLTRNPAAFLENNKDHGDLVAFASLPSALTHLDGMHAAGTLEHVYLIGGGQIYAEALQLPACTRVFLTRVETAVPDADTWFPTEQVLNEFTRVSDWAEVVRLVGADAVKAVPEGGQVSTGEVPYSIQLWTRGTSC